MCANVAQINCATSCQHQAPAATSSSRRARAQLVAVDLYVVHLSFSAHLCARFILNRTEQNTWSPTIYYIKECLRRTNECRANRHIR